MILSNRGNMGLRIIVFIGAATFLFLMLMAFGLKRSLQPQAGARVPDHAATSPFQQDRAWTDAEALQTVPPTPAAWQEYVSRTLRKMGVKTRRMGFEGGGPADEGTGAAIIGVIEGNRPGVVVLCVVLDASTADHERSAADGAWLLEMARILGAQRDGRSVWAVFLSEPRGREEDNASMASRAGEHFLTALESSAELASIEALFSVQGIGDCALAVQKEIGAPTELTEILWNTASREDYGKFFGKLPARLRGAHLAFRKAGIPAMVLADTHPGPSGKKADSAANASGFCRESLRAVGDVIYHALAPLEGHLDGTGMRSDGH